MNKIVKTLNLSIDLTLPLEVAENEGIGTYTILSEGGKIIKRYSREIMPNDTAAVNADGVTIHHFHGVWHETPQSEIDKLNEARHKSHSVYRDTSLTVRSIRELEIKKVEELLQRLKDKEVI